jgi:hypothetical protein
MLGVKVTSVNQFTVRESCDWRRTLGWQQLNPLRRAGEQQEFEVLG